MSNHSDKKKQCFTTKITRRTQPNRQTTNDNSIRNRIVFCKYLWISKYIFTNKLTVTIFRTKWK